METMPDKYRLRIRVLYGIIGVLLVFIFSIVATIVFHNREYKKEMAQQQERHERGKGHFIIEQLGLNEEQEKIFASSRQQFFRDSKVIIDSLSVLRSKMLNELAKESPDTLVLQDIAVKMGLMQTQLKKETIQHFLEVKSVCTPEQQEKLNELFQRLIFMQDPPFGKGRRPGGTGEGRHHPPCDEFSRIHGPKL